MLIKVTVNNPDDQDVAVELVGLLYQQSMILTILAHVSYKYAFKTTNDIGSNPNSINPKCPSLLFKVQILEQIWKIIDKFDCFGLSKMICP